MMLLTLPGKDTDGWDRSGHKGENGELREWAGTWPIGLLTLDEPRWSTIFKRYVNI